MATVLLVIDSPTIESLMAELVMYAGYQPVLPCGDESATEAIRRRSPDIVIIDIDLAMPVVEAGERAARETSAALVYLASGNHPGELRALAESRRAAHFALPNGPKLLARVLADALVRSGRQAIEPDILPSYEFITALRTIAEARRLAMAARVVQYENRNLRDLKQQLLDEAHSKLEQVRSAAMDYLRNLRGDGVPPERAMELVTAAMRESAQATGVPDLFVGVERDAVGWVEEAYRAA